MNNYNEQPLTLYEFENTMDELHLSESTCFLEDEQVANQVATMNIIERTKTLIQQKINIRKSDRQREMERQAVKHGPDVFSVSYNVDDRVIKVLFKEIKTLIKATSSGHVINTNSMGMSSNKLFTGIIVAYPTLNYQIDRGSAFVTMSLANEYLRNCDRFMANLAMVMDKTHRQRNKGRIDDEQMGYLLNQMKHILMLLDTVEKACGVAVANVTNNL